MSRPNPELFDSSWRLNCQVKRVNKNKVEHMIQSHYLEQWPQNTFLILGLEHKKDFLGVITYSIPHRSLMARYGENSLELSRLWIDDSVPRNAETFLIGRSVRYVKKNHKDIGTLISFADPKMGHNGTIYKAANWKQEEHESKNLFIYRLK